MDPVTATARAGTSVFDEPHRTLSDDPAVTTAREGTSSFDEPHKLAPFTPPPSTVQLDHRPDLVAALTEIGRLVVEIRLLERLAEVHQEGATAWAGHRDNARFHTACQARDQVNATIAGRRLVLGNLSTTIADRYHTKRGA